MKRKCLTPDAMYHIHVQPGSLRVHVEGALLSAMSEPEAKQLSDEVHDALEAVLQKYWAEAPALRLVNADE